LAFFLLSENDQKAEAEVLIHEDFEQNTYKLEGQDLEGFKGPHATLLDLITMVLKSLEDQRSLLQHLQGGNPVIIGADDLGKERKVKT
jgi:hypothetical protein